jgi:hypothetical protein
MPTPRVSARPDAALQSPPPAAEWCVRVAISVADLVPAALLRAWIVVEGFCRDQPSCWPGNKALAARLGVGTVRAAQAVLEQLEDYGLAERRQLEGNRRVIVLIRRTAEPLTAAEWRALVERAERRAAGRSALAAEKKAKRAARPRLKVVG